MTGDGTGAWPAPGRYGLVLVSGSAPGAGKSALSAALARGLAAGGHAVAYHSEDDLLGREDFARVDRQLGASDPGATHPDRALLAAARALLAGGPASPGPPPGLPHGAAARGAPAGGTRILDALLPDYFWLSGRYPPARVEAYGDALAALLAPLRPLLVYLRGDPAALLRRAAAARGPGWPDRSAAAVARWRLPHYPDPGGAPGDPDGVARFLGWLDGRTRALLARWPGDTLVLDAMEPLADLELDLLAHCAPPQRAGAPARRLYHGTVAEDVGAFEPRRRYTPGALGPAAPHAVYAGDDPAYAAAHAIPWSSTEGFRLSYTTPFEAGGRPVLGVPAGQEGRLARPVTVYTLPADAFEPLETVTPAGRNFRSRAPVRPVGVARFPTARAAVEHYGGRVEVAGEAPDS